MVRTGNPFRESDLSMGALTSSSLFTDQLLAKSIFCGSCPTEQLDENLVSSLKTLQSNRKGKDATIAKCMNACIDRHRDIDTQIKRLKNNWRISSVEDLSF